MWEFLAVGARDRSEIDKLSRAFESTIRLFGGRENPF